MATQNGGSNQSPDSSQPSGDDFGDLLSSAHNGKTPNQTLTKTSSIGNKHDRDSDETQDDNDTSEHKRLRAGNASPPNSNISNIAMMQPPPLPSTVSSNFNKMVNEFNLDSPRSTPNPTLGNTPANNLQTTPAIQVTEPSQQVADAEPTSASLPQVPFGPPANSLNGSAASTGTQKSGLRDPSKNPFRQHDFIRGELIVAPHHCTAHDPKAVEMLGKGFYATDIGIVSSKRRPMVVMWAHSDYIFAIPLATHSGNGLSNMSDSVWDQHICLRLRDDYTFHNEGSRPPLEIHRLDGNFELRNSSLRLTDGYTVSMREDIKTIGVLTGSSTNKLYSLWMDEKDKALEAGEAADRRRKQLNADRERRERERLGRQDDLRRHALNRSRSTRF